MSFTLAQLKTSVLNRLGWPASDTFCTNAELTEYVVESAKELWSLLATVHRAGQWGYSSATITTVAGTTTYSLATNFGRLIAVRLKYGQQLVPLRRRDTTVDVVNSNNYGWTPSIATYNVFIADDGTFGIVFDPPPAAVYTVFVYYVAAAPFPTSADSEVNWMGEDEYIILDVMRKCRIKEEADVSELESAKDRYQKRLEDDGIQFDLGEAPHVTDARAAASSQTDMMWWYR
jgi:hypothetical protein